MKSNVVIIMAWALTVCAYGHPKESSVITSPDGNIKVEVDVNGKSVSYSVFDQGKLLTKDNHIALHLSNGIVLGENSKVKETHIENKKESIDAPFYRTPHFDVAYQQLTLKMDKGGVIFRAYNEGVAYRFSTSQELEGVSLQVLNETAEFHFPNDPLVWLSYSTNQKNPMAMAFQNYYTETTLSKTNPQLAFLPATIDCQGTKLTITESDVEEYPGMFVKADGLSLKAVFPPYPKEKAVNDWRKQELITATEPFMAKVSKSRPFPWRVLSVSRDDKDMPVNPLVYALASPNRIGDTSWIRPGKCAWEWWNDWGLEGIEDFRPGINTATYKAYIDFAARQGLEYMVIDEGWYEPSSGDMLTVMPDIDLPEIMSFAKEKKVDIILWTVFNVLDSQLDEACAKYAAMGVKGFKVDFLDRFDQQAVEMLYRIAGTAAQHHLMLDLHGTYTPTGYERTFPNIVNVESVFGMEEVKWEPVDKDMPKYDVTFPFIRMQNGPVDFTQGGMRNAAKTVWKPDYKRPMTMGTRCHQAAMYVVYDSPLAMLADSPTEYDKDPVFTKAIAGVPTVFDETRVLQGKMGEYIVTARRKGNEWYVGALTSWTPRTLQVSMDFLQKGVSYNIITLCDGGNAGQDATDYVLSHGKTDAQNAISLNLASGGGAYIKLTPAQ